MEKATLIKLRELAYKATMTLYNKNKDCPEDKRTMVVRCPLNIVCDNSLNITDDPINHNVIWDDANGCLYYFTYNGESAFYNPATAAISFGDKPIVSGICILIDYDEIQNIRIQLSEESFDNFTANISAMTQEQKDAIKNHLFRDTDQRVIIKRKNKTSYITTMDKDKDPSTRHYNDMHEYNKTIHPMAF